MFHVLSPGLYFIWVYTIVASPLLLSSIVCASLAWWHFECLAKHELECGESPIEAPLLAHGHQFGQAVLSPPREDIVEVIFFVGHCRVGFGFVCLGEHIFSYFGALFLIVFLLTLSGSSRTSELWKPQLPRSVECTTTGSLWFVQFRLCHKLRCLCHKLRCRSFCFLFTRTRTRTQSSKPRLYNPNPNPNHSVVFVFFSQFSGRQRVHSGLRKWKKGNQECHCLTKYPNQPGGKHGNKEYRVRGTICKGKGKAKAKAKAKAKGKGKGKGLLVFFCRSHHSHWFARVE